MKTYLLACALIFIWIIQFWLVLPYLFSADDTILVGIGLGLTLATIPVFFMLVRKIWLSVEIQAFIKKIGELSK